MIVIDGEQFKIDVLSVKRSADFWINTRSASPTATLGAS